MSALKRKDHDSILDNISSEAWRANLREAEGKLDTLRREHGQALLAGEAAASRVAASAPDSRRDHEEAREKVAELEDAIAAAVTVVDAARRELLTAQGREEEVAAAERVKQTEACAKECTAAAEAVEQLAAKLQAACSTYMTVATRYGQLTGRGRDFARAEHHGHLRANLRNVVVTTVAALEIPGYSDRTRQLLKPKTTPNFLD